MIKKILVPLDGSSLAERAVPVAARIARASLGSILFLRVVSTASEFGVYMSEPSVLMQETIEEDLASAADYLAQVTKSPVLAGLKVDVGIFTGAAALQILDVARTEEVDLIVMCSHGETGIKRWVMGSVAQKVIRHSPVPVLVLRDTGLFTANLCREAGYPLRVLVTLDGSPLSEKVLEPTAQIVSRLARPERAELHLLRVVDMPNRYGGWHSQSHIDETIIEQARQTATAYISGVAERLRADIAGESGLDITTSVMMNPDIEGTIVNIAEHGEDTRGYDLIAMATHGRGGIARWAMGSVTERVLDSTKLPLFIVRPQQVLAHAQSNNPEPLTAST